ncbi:hypothetical protein FW774_11720 [Pedobacter sp. BS3]|uniref:hypothetical protein n=1 Tax=Pedobacter sp. BS3 TaxID=2567937 RepID=UPI0011EE1407|nr:hypothetical protein [Pedobacter sp. BS3]TZF84101.1 hypothetical protein FW774_11720 [Pedobacter sp. BS3]
MKTENLFLKVWGIPVILAILSIFGLLSALIGDNFWDVLSWVTLGIPVAVMAWFLIKKKGNRVKGNYKTDFVDV